MDVTSVTAMPIQGVGPKVTFSDHAYKGRMAKRIMADVTKESKPGQEFVD
jgi:hypothetical protein